MSAGEPVASDRLGVVRLRDGTTATLRPIRPTDEPLVVVFHAGLSPRTVYQRYFHIATLEQRTSQQRLALACRIDPAEGAAIVAELRRDEGTLEILAVGRIRRTDVDRAEVAVVVADRVQGQGLGTAITRALIDEARRLGVRHLYGEMFADNDAMHAVVRRAGFTVRPVDGDARVLRAELTLH